MYFWTVFFTASLACAGHVTFKEETLNSSSISELLISSAKLSLQIVDEAYQHSRERRSTSSFSKHGFEFRLQAEPETQEISRAGEVFQTALQVLRNTAKQKYERIFTASELLSRQEVQLLAELSGCPSVAHKDKCELSRHSMYRTISGVCNNRKNPRWGAANTALVRWLPAEYEDEEGEPKGWNRDRLHNGFQLPLPRRLSREIISSSCKWRDDDYSQLLVEWGQYIDHDITFTPQSISSRAFWTDVDCYHTCDNVHPCFPIEKDKSSCMPFHRSTADCYINSSFDVHQALQRQQLNAITSYIDASLVYGHTPMLESSLRDFSDRGGKMAVNDQFEDSKGRPYLPFVTKVPPPSCAGGEGLRGECFSAGDSRVNEGLPLVALHTLWLREHNRIAESLELINDHWSPEMIYQESRRIIGALHQIVTMRDYVPKIIGSESFDHHMGPYRGYDPAVDASASNVFATAAFRFGHATISPVLHRLNESFQEHEQFPHLRLRETFFSPWRIVKEGGIEPTMRGLIGTAAPAASARRLLVQEVTEMLTVLDTQQHMDLASLNLQRGRDHGLPGYNKWREFCGLAKVNTMDDLKQVMGDDKVAELILSMYKHPDNIDVWLGGLVEDFLSGARTGPLFACLIAKQMKALRDGDRFWWEADGIFTKRQKDELLKGSLSRVICDNTDIHEIPTDPFKFGKYPNDYVECAHIPALNLEAWREEKSRDYELCGTPTQIQNGDMILISKTGKVTVLYSCYHGFKLKGSAELVCDGNRWSPEAPHCSGDLKS